MRNIDIFTIWDGGQRENICPFQPNSLIAFSTERQIIISMYKKSYFYQEVLLWINLGTEHVLNLLSYMNGSG